MKTTEFTVIRFENRNGVTSWRVFSGWLHGIRIRKNFKDQRRSHRWRRGSLILRSIQADAGLRPATTLLAARPAPGGGVRLFRRLGGDTCSLCHVLCRIRPPKLSGARATNGVGCGGQHLRRDLAQGNESHAPVVPAAQVDPATSLEVPAFSIGAGLAIHA